MIKKERRYPIVKILTIGIMPSFIKKFIYRLKGYKIGKDVKIGLGSIICGKEVFINDNSSISFGVVIKVDKLIIGKNVRINTGTFIDTREVHLNDDSIIGEMVGIGGIRTEQSLLKIGKRCHVFPYSLINPTLPIILGDDSSFGYANYVFTHASWNSMLDGYPVVFAPIKIGKGVWLPSRVQIFPNVTIGNGAVIGAGSIVTKSIPANCFAVGSPAKIKLENYPPPIDEEKRNDILKQIVSDFIDHLEYNDYHVKKVLFEEGFELSIHKGKKTYNIKYINKSKFIEHIDYDNLLIMDARDLQISTKNIKMWINLRTKTRFGTSEVGEEFTKFISRYGIRFNRLD